MPDVNERLTRFEKAVFSEVEAKANEILSEVDAYKEEKVAGAQDDELQQSYQKIQQKIDEIRSNFAKEVTREKLSAKQQLLLKRKELTEALFQEAGKKLEAYTASGEYDAWLEKTLKKDQAYLSEGAKILTRGEDAERIRKLAGSVPVEVSASIRLGGFVIVQDEKQIYLDETFDTRMETAREQFYASGKADLK